MKVTVKQIKAKIPSLPANVRDLVTIGKKGSAQVKSFTSQAVYDVHLEPYKNDPENKEVLNATCGCAAHELCKHICAFWAVAKGELPVAGFVGKTEEEDAKPREDALRRLTKEAIHADLCAHEARAAMLEEIERRAR